MKEKISQKIHKKKDTSKYTQLHQGLKATTSPDDIDHDPETKTKEDPETNSAIIYEQAITKTNSLIKSNISWANAALLALALPNTIEVNTWSDIGNAWFYFVICFLCSIALAVLPRTWEDPKEVQRELALHPKQKAATAAQSAKQAAKKHGLTIQEESDSSRRHSRSKSIQGDELLKFVEVQGNELGENLEDILVFTVGNVVAMALRDAAKASFESILGKDEEDMTTTLWMFYALFVTIVTVTFTIKLGNMFDHFEKQCLADIEEQGLDEAKDEMILFALRKRALNLTTTTLSLCMAWSWRDAIKSLILSMYGGDTSTLAHVWLYAATATAFTTFNNAVCSHYILVYPRNENVPNLQMGTKSRDLVSKTFADNVNFIAAFAWYDALTQSFDDIAEQDIEAWIQVLFYWIMAIGMQIASLGLKYIWEKYDSNIELMEKGVANAFLQLKRVFDPDNILGKNDKDLARSEKMEPFYWASTKAFANLCVYCLGTSSSLFVTTSLKYTIAAAYSKYYDLNSGDVPTDGIWMVWVALAISIGISVLVVTYLSKAIDAARNVRRLVLSTDSHKSPKRTQSMPGGLIGQDDDEDDDSDVDELGQPRTHGGNAIVVETGYDDDDNNNDNDEGARKKKIKKRKSTGDIKTTKGIDEGNGMQDVQLTVEDDGGADDGGDDAADAVDDGGAADADDGGADVGGDDGGDDGGDAAASS